MLSLSKDAPYQVGPGMTGGTPPIIRDIQMVE